MDLELLPSLLPTYELLEKAVYSGLAHLTGPSGIGKTTLVKKLFAEKDKEYLHAYIDCYSIRNQNQLLSKICEDFHSAMNVRRSRAGKNVQPLPEPGSTVSLSDFYDYFLEYKKIAHDKGYRRIFVVLDQVEVFDRSNMMDTFVALCRYNMMDLRLVLISCEHYVDMVHYVAQKSASVAMSVQDRCQVVVCNQWSGEDIVNWIMQSPPKERVELYKKFVKNVVTLVTTTQSRDPVMIRMYCQEHFGDFIAYYKKRRREKVLKELDLDPNSSEVTDKELDEYELEGGLNSNLLVSNFLLTFKVMIKEQKDYSKWTSSDRETHLTENVGILIVAAYVAAYTKISDDKANFIRYQRRKTSSRSKEKCDHQNRLFTLERLVQIYVELTKKSTGFEKPNYIKNTDRVLADVERLEGLGILHRQSGFQFCSEARYKLSSNIRQDYVARLAENNSLDLDYFQGLPESYEARN